MGRWGRSVTLPLRVNHLLALSRKGSGLFESARREEEQEGPSGTPQQGCPRSLLPAAAPGAEGGCGRLGASSSSSPSLGEQPRSHDSSSRNFSARGCAPAVPAARQHILAHSPHVSGEAELLFSEPPRGNPGESRSGKPRPRRAEDARSWQRSGWGSLAGWEAIGVPPGIAPHSCPQISDAPTSAARCPTQPRWSGAAPPQLPAPLAVLAPGGTI